MVLSQSLNFFCKSAPPPPSSGQAPVQWGQVTTLWGPCYHVHTECRSDILSTDHELIPARNASIAALQGSASGSNVRYYPTRKHSPFKEKMNKAVTMQSKLPDVCS
jgi:hypothetical protein